MDSLVADLFVREQIDGRWCDAEWESERNFFFFGFSCVATVSWPCPRRAGIKKMFFICRTPHGHICAFHILQHVHHLKYGLCASFLFRILYQLPNWFLGIFIPVLGDAALSWIIGVTIIFCRSDMTKGQMIVHLAFKSKILLWGGIACGSLSIGYAVMRYDSFRILSFML